MPIFAKNFIISGTESQEATNSASEPSTVVEPKVVVEESVSTTPTPEAGVIINGKVKKISKKSASTYLLDMLTLDD